MNVLQTLFTNPYVQIMLSSNLGKPVETPVFHLPP
jgi:hypothetical protein